MWVLNASIFFAITDDHTYHVGYLGRWEVKSKLQNSKLVSCDLSHLHLSADRAAMLIILMWLSCNQSQLACQNSGFWPKPSRGCEFWPSLAQPILAWLGPALGLELGQWYVLDTIPMRRTKQAEDLWCISVKLQKCRRLSTYRKPNNSPHIQSWWHFALHSTTSNITTMPSVPSLSCLLLSLPYLLCYILIFDHL
jgi:hypothetical protein